MHPGKLNGHYDLDGEVCFIDGSLIYVKLLKLTEVTFSKLLIFLPISLFTITSILYRYNNFKHEVLTEKWS